MQREMPDVDAVEHAKKSKPTNPMLFPYFRQDPQTLTHITSSSPNCVTAQSFSFRACFILLSTASRYSLVVT